MLIDKPSEAPYSDVAHDVTLTVIARFFAPDHLEKRNRASTYDRILYESERKRFYEGRTASSAAFSRAKKTLAQQGVSSFVEQKNKFPRK